MIELFRERDLRPELVYDLRATDLLYDGLCLKSPNTPVNFWSARRLVTTLA